MSAEPVALNLRVFGLVQGVGFRPFLFRIAESRGLSGWVLNRSDCVELRVEGQRAAVRAFLTELEQAPPALSRIEGIESEFVDPEGLTGFVIRASRDVAAGITRVSPDMAVCEDCLTDIRNQHNRIDYPFVNCTNCGPRFSIVEDLPYDRFRTTMAEFAMCESCQGEYDNLRDRRFHAQPNACADCGPVYTYIEGDDTLTEIHEILDRAAGLIARGGIAAIKGIGGFHLACDARNREAVRRLRAAKIREAKPFAIMCRSVETARSVVQIDGTEESALISPRRPIVLLAAKSRPPAVPQETAPIAPEVADGLDSFGVMLPYTALHTLLFERLTTDALVLTSGNVSDEPIAIGNEDALKRLAGIADAFLVYNRRIHNRSDDSVAMVVNGIPRLLRRSRGWAPEPIALAFEAEGIAAVGGELKNTFCIGKGNTAICSQHIGDLKNAETIEFFTEAFERFGRLFRFKPDTIGCDLHPDYLSTRFAEATGSPLITVQHHHAHVASCLAEHQLEGPAIGVSFDGTGLGDDDAVWGGEFLLFDLAGYTRVGHIAYIPMPGGDSAAKEPWRMAVAYLRKAMPEELQKRRLPIFETVAEADLELVLSAIEAGVNSPMTSSAGRLFDAAAAIAGLIGRSRYEAEAPMRLQAAITATEQCYPFGIEGTEKDRFLLDFDDCIGELVGDVCSRVPVGEIAGRFHNTVIEAIVASTLRVSLQTGVSLVALSGGVFQNRAILEPLERRLEREGLQVISNLRVPANDGGIALGQLAVAAKLRAG